MKHSITRADEKKFLLAVLGRLGKEQPWGLLRRLKWQLAVWCIAFLLVFTAYNTFGDPEPFKILLAIVSFVCGLSIGFATWRLASARKWPVLARCIDRAKVEERLRELDA